MPIADNWWRTLATGVSVCDDITSIDIAGNAIMELFHVHRAI